MTDQDSTTRTLGEVLPAIVTSITATVSSAPSTSVSSAPPARLSDAELSEAVATAAMPLPALAEADTNDLARCLRMMATLPRRKEDIVGGRLRVRAYELAIGPRSKDALEFLVTEAMRSCKFFPSTAECVEILARWQRRDEAVLTKLRAARTVEMERQARFDEIMSRLAAGECSQDEIDVLPASWKSVAETRSYLWRHEDGTYTSRVQQ